VLFSSNNTTNTMLGKTTTNYYNNNSNNYPTTQLTLEQMNSCGHAAYLKHVASTGFDTKGMKEDFLLDFSAFGSELAVAKFLNIPPQTGINNYGLPDIVHNGRKIDVKTTKHSWYEHMTVETVRNDWWYFCVKSSLDTATFQLIGYCKGSSIPTGLKDFGNGRPPCRAILIKDLTPFSGSFPNG
jgi:hypothetical protein